MEPPSFPWWGCLRLSTSTGISSPGRMSLIVIARNSSTEYPYLRTAASFTIKNRSVSLSKTHVGWGLLSTNLRCRSSLSCSNSCARFCSVMSRVTLENPRSSPAPSLMEANDYVGPKSRPILSYPPGFLFVTVFGDGSLQLALRFADGYIFRRIKTGEMVAKDFIARAPLDALGSLIPGRDKSLGIKHENGVVLDTVDQPSKAILTLPQRFVGPLALGYVSVR